MPASRLTPSRWAQLKRIDLWGLDALERMVRTFAVVAISDGIGQSGVLDWRDLLNVGGLAALYSLGSTLLSILVVVPGVKNSRLRWVLDVTERATRTFLQAGLAKITLDHPHGLAQINWDLVAHMSLTAAIGSVVLAASTVGLASAVSASVLPKVNGKALAR